MRRHKKYRQRLFDLLKHPFFWILTVIGNSLIIFGSILLKHFEFANTNLNFLDALLWATGIVTTIGYGEYTATTLGGKITLLALMFMGTLFVWTYMAFLVTALITPELSAIEKDVEDVEKELKDLMHSKRS